MPTDDKVALCVATFYQDLADKLEAGAREALEQGGITEIEKFEVPGAFELPLIARYAAQSGKFKAIVALGAVIRGETDHYDYVCGEAARGIQTVQLTTGIPVGFGVLTVDSMDQALDRVQGGSKRDTGAHAAQAALAALKVKDDLDERPVKIGFSGLAKRLPVLLARKPVTPIKPSTGSVTIRHPKTGSSLLYWSAVCQRFATSARRVRPSATAAATRWLPPTGALIRTSSGFGSMMPALRVACMYARAASRLARSPRLSRAGFEAATVVSDT